MLTKKIIAPLILVILVAGVSGVMAAKKTTDKRAANNLGVATFAEGNPSLANQPGSDVSNSNQSSGRYIDFSQDKLADSSYNTTVLFFYAAWCPECRSFKQAITSGTIPTGVQVLEVNYVDSSDLKKAYGVTLQSTFVKVDSSGKQLGKWVGYGKEKKLQTVLSNL